MPYCTRCGIKLPEDEEARFCPNCGAPIFHKARGYAKDEREARRSLPVASRKNRLLVFLFAFFLCIVVTSIGALSKIDNLEAQVIIEDFKRIEEMLQTAGIQLIFGNNMMYCLVMFIPFVGPIGGFYVLYSTGKILAALSSVLGVDPMLLFLNLLIYPHAWLEYSAYSLAISESMWLSFYALKYGFRGLRTEAVNAAKHISICVVLLLSGAFVEMALITLVSPSLFT